MYLILLSLLYGCGYYAVTYLKNIREEVSELKTQNSSIVKANESISNDMKGVKTLTENYQQKIIEIRTNTHTITQVTASPQFHDDALHNTDQAATELNAVINNLFVEINGETNVIQ
jgi:hypothetical protein